jgi:hypothetical protein
MKAHSSGTVTSIFKAFPDSAPTDSRVRLSIESAALIARSSPASAAVFSEEISAFMPQT